MDLARALVAYILLTWALLLSFLLTCLLWGCTGSAGLVSAEGGVT